MTSKNKNVKMTRAKADKLVEEVRRRIIEVNRDENFCVMITEARIFGSYVNAPEKDRLSDLDVALRVKYKYSNTDPRMIASRERCPEYMCKGDAGLLNRHAWPKEEAMRYIRKRNPYISLNSRIDDPDERKYIFDGPTMVLDLEGSSQGKN